MKESRSRIPAPLEEVGVILGVASMVGQPHIEAAMAPAAESEVNLKRLLCMEGKMISVDIVMDPEGVVIEGGEEIEIEANEAGAGDVVAEAGALTKADEEAANITKTLHPRPPARDIHQPIQKQTSHLFYLPHKSLSPGPGPNKNSQTHQNKSHLLRRLPHPRI